MSREFIDFIYRDIWDFSFLINNIASRNLYRHTAPTCLKDAGPSVQTASELDRCTCCSSSQSPAVEVQQGDRLHEAVSHSHRSSEPVEQSIRHL